MLRYSGQNLGCVYPEIAIEMRKYRFLIITFVSFFSVLGEGFLKKTLSIALCGLLSFNSLSCPVDWNYGKVNAAVPQRTAINGISKWWATAGKDKFISTTLSLDIAEKDKYRLDINIGGEGFFSSEWDFSDSKATLKSLESGEVIEESKLTGEFESSRELDPGVYELQITNIEVPEKPIVEQVEFILNRKIRKNPRKDKLTTLFIADRPEPNLLNQSQIDELINEYAPILYFDKGELNENKPELFPMPFSVPEIWRCQNRKDKTPQITGDSTQSIKLDQYPYQDTDEKDVKCPYSREPAIYASISENKDKSEIAINYYFHYPRSNWKDYGGLNTHQGDWEGIAVFLDVVTSDNSSLTLIPDKVAFSQHVKVDLSVLRNIISLLGLARSRLLKTGLIARLIKDASTGGMTVPWEYLDHPNNSNRTNVYVGLGAHASFPFRGITGFNRPPKKEDFDVSTIQDVLDKIASYNANQEFHKGDLSSFNPSPEQIHNLPRAGKKSQLGDSHGWLFFPGFWGEKEKENPEGKPPRGPMFLDWDFEVFGDKSEIGDDEGLGTRWLDPWKWSENFDKIIKGSNNINNFADGRIVIEPEETNLYSDEERSILRGGIGNNIYTLEDDGTDIKNLGGDDKNDVERGAGGSFIQDPGGTNDKLSIEKDTSALPGGVEQVPLSLCEGQPLERDGTALLINYDLQGSPKYAEDITVLDFFKNPTGAAEPGIGFIEQINDLTGQQIIDYFNNGRKDKSCEAKRDLEGVSGRIFGDPHLLTFDRRRLSFQAVGEFIQAQTLDDQFEVQGRYKQAGENASLVNAVAIKLGQDRVGFYAGQNSQLRVNEKLTTVEDNLLVLPGGGQIYRDNGTYVVVSPNGEGVKVQEVSAGDGSLIVEVVMPETQRGQVKGLLGNFNGDSSDDIQTRTGEVLPKNPNYEQLYKEFGNSWRIHHRESLFDYAPGETTATFTNSSFPAKIVRTNDFSSNARAAAERTCQAAGVTEPELLEACIFDILVTRDNRFVQVSASVAQTLTSSIEATPDEGRIRDGDYSEGPGEFALTVQGNRYRYYGGHDGWISEWFPISKLQYIRDGVVFDGETYWCHLEDKGETGWICSANGW